MTKEKLLNSVSLSFPVHAVGTVVTPVSERNHAKCQALEVTQTTVAAAGFYCKDASLSLQNAQALWTGLQLGSVVPQSELCPPLPEGVEGGSALCPSSLISLSHSPRALHSHPDLLPGAASLLGMCLGRGHLSLCSSSITASINTGNAVLFPRHDCTRLCWMRHAPSRKRPPNPLSKLTTPG